MTDRALSSVQYLSKRSKICSMLVYSHFNSCHAYCTLVSKTPAHCVHAVLSLLTRHAITTRGTAGHAWTYMLHALVSPNKHSHMCSNSRNSRTNNSSISSKAEHAIHWLQVVGTLRAEVAQELGLAGDVQVAPGSGDNQMSALGAGAVHEGTWVMSLGTSGTLFGLSTKPVLDPSGAVSPFCDATGSWLPLLCTMNCTTVTEEVRASTPTPPPPP